MMLLTGYFKMCYVLNLFANDDVNNLLNTKWLLWWNTKML